MKNPLRNTSVYLSEKWKNWPYKGITLGIILIIIILLVIGILSNPAKEEVSQEKTLPKVTVKSLNELQNDSVIEKTVSTRATKSGELIARAGGRVTAIRTPLGSYAKSGAVVVEIDGGTEGNPTQAQINGASQVLSLFNTIEAQAIKTADIGVAIAQQTYNSAKSGKEITAEIQAKNKEAADNAVRQAKVNQETALEANVDLAIRSANIAVDAAGVAQDQSRLASNLSGVQSSRAQKQAENLQIAIATASRTRAELASTRVNLNTQLQVAVEQRKLQQVTAPVSGTVTRLTVAIGDYVRPGAVVGSVVAGSTVTSHIEVPVSIAGSLTKGQVLEAMSANKKAKAIITEVSASYGVNSSSAQINVIIESEDGAPVAPNNTTIVRIPVKTYSSTLVIPLDAINVRESGSVVLTVNTDNSVQAHIVTPIEYFDGLVEVVSDITNDDRIITNGNRTLQEGDLVEVAK